MIINEGSGSIFNDAVNGEKYKLIAGARTTTGKGEAIHFTHGANHYIDLMDSSKVKPMAPAISIELLTYITNAASAYDALWSWEVGTSWRCVLTFSIWRTRVVGGGGTSDLTMPTIPNGLQHIVAIYNGTNQMLYRNGQLVATRLSVHAGSPIGLSDATNIWLGDSADSLSWGQKALLFRVYKTALSPVEINQLYQQPYAMFTRPIMAQPYLNFGSGGAPPAVTPKRKPTRVFIEVSWWEQMMRNLGIG